MRCFSRSLPTTLSGVCLASCLFLCLGLSGNHAHANNNLIREKLKISNLRQTCTTLIILVYVRCLTNQSAAIVYVTGCTYAVQPIRARLWRTSRGVRTLFDQSKRGYGVRHGVYVRFSTNQDTVL